MGLCAALALIALGQAVSFTPGPSELTLTADVIRYETDTQRVAAEGHVELTGQGITVRARRMTYDTLARRIDADDALIIRDKTAGVADHVQLDVDTYDANLTGGVFVEKKELPPDLAKATTAAQVLGLGRNQLALRGSRIRRISDKELEVEHLSFTPCDCNPANPSWRIDARRADVTMGDSVFLSWPVIYVHGVPVLALPPLSLPLSDRRSGLLVPKPGTSTLNGFSIEQPFFLTLGPSYDLTFTPGYFFGTSQVAGVRGPRLVTDLRYAPVVGTRGEFALSLIDDLKAPRPPDQPGVKLPGQRGLRWDLGGTHTQELGGGFHDRVDLSLASDGYYVTDQSSDLLAKQNKYLASTATLYQAEADRFLGVALAYRQDLRYGFNLLGTNQTQSGMYGPRTLQQLPDAVAAWPERHLFGPLAGALDLRFTRLSPLSGRFGDEGVDGVYTLPAFNYGPPSAGAGDRNFEPGERESRDRFDLHPSVTTTWSAGHFLDVTPTLALREDLYAGELSGDTAQRGHAWADLRVDSRLARTFGRAGGITHAIEPSVELRYAPGGWGTALGPTVGPLGAALRPYDEVDLAMPDEGITQMVAQISQKLLRRTGLGVSELLRLDVGQEFDLRAAHPPRDAFARVGTQLGGLNLTGIARYDVQGRRLSGLSGSAAFNFGTVAGLYAVYDNLLFGGTARERRGLDTLVGTAYAQGVIDRVQLLTAGARTEIGGGLGLTYNALLQPSAVQPLAQQSLGLFYAPACDCWRLDVQVSSYRSPDNRVFGDFRVTGGLTINHFGSIGAGG